MIQTRTRDTPQQIPLPHTMQAENRGSVLLCKCGAPAKSIPAEISELTGVEWKDQPHTLLSEGWLWLPYAMSGFSWHSHVFIAHFNRSIRQAGADPALLFD